MPPPRIAFIGFGEAAAVFSLALRRNGVDVSAYDRNLDREGGLARLRARARTDGIRFAPLPEAVQGADLVLSTVKPQTAVDAALACAARLRPGQFFVDLNTVSPAVKIEIGSIVQPTGADYVEGAILGAVGTTGASSRILTGGPKGGHVADVLSGAGLSVTHYSPEIGKASLFKMLRSVFSKGLETLILELRVAGKRAGIERDLWKDVVAFMTENPFDRVADTWIRSHPGARERRLHEMGEVAETLRGLGLDPLMTGATEAFFRRSCSLDWAENPGSAEAVVDLLERQLRPTKDGDA